MIRFDKINEKVIGRVGWKQPTLSGSPVVTVANLVSTSGLYFQGGSGLVTLENIKSCQEDPTISDADFNTYLADLVKDSFADLLSAVGFNSMDLIANRLLFGNANTWDKPINNDVSFVGYEFEIKHDNISAIINQVVTEFDFDGTVELFVFNSQKKNYITKTSISVLEDDSVITDLNQVLDQLGLYKGGIFYIGFHRY